MRRLDLFSRRSRQGPLPDRPGESHKRKACDKSVENGPTPQCEPANAIGGDEDIAPPIEATNAWRNSLNSRSRGELVSVEASVARFTEAGSPVRRPELIGRDRKGRGREYDEKPLPPPAPDCNQREKGATKEREEADNREPDGDVERSTVEWRLVGTG
jgi:hypothetical protein